MTSEQLIAVAHARLDEVKERIVAKNKHYSRGDALSNFKFGAQVQRTTQEKCLLGYATKHLVSIIDMVNDESEHSIDQWAEKIGDAIVYFCILEAMAHDRANPVS